MRPASALEEDMAREQAQVDPEWWTSGTHQDRPIREILRDRDISALFDFLATQGWSRAAIAGTTGLSETRVREVRQGRQRVSAYEVFERIADGLRIDRGLMGLAYNDAGMRGSRRWDIDDELSSERGMFQHPVDRKYMARVDEGVFRRGRNDEMVWLPAYWIDVTPVSNAEYARFLDATGHRRPPHWTNGVCPDELADHPVVFVTHTDATRYAAWAGKVLPSEKEWEKAARGPSGYTYPWGDQPTPAKCNVRETGIGTTTPVGLYRSGVSPYGVYDLAGNVWEWCRTQTSPGRFVLKGSAFTSPFAAAAAAETNDAAAEMLDDDTGFRCVIPNDRMPPPAAK